MTNKALANAERVADEALDYLSRTNAAFRAFIKGAEDTYPESFDDDRAFVDSVDEQVKRLRSELEGQP